MNKYFYTLAILLLGVSAHAQTFTEQQDSLFQHLDKNKIPSGVLYNRVFPWAGLDLGKDNDFNITYDYAKQAWLELELATYNPEGLLSLEELEQRVQQNNFENKGISIGYIDYYFNSIDSNAFINGDLIIGEDSLLYDGPGNPYSEHLTINILAKTFNSLIKNQKKLSKGYNFTKRVIIFDETKKNDYEKITIIYLSHTAFIAIMQ